MTARVPGVRARSTCSAVTLPETGSASAKTGRWPARTTAFAQATQVNAGRTTSDPGGRSRETAARWSAFEPLSVIAKSAPIRSPKTCSNSRTFGPMPIQPARRLGASSSSSSWPAAAPETPIVTTAPTGGDEVSRRGIARTISRRSGGVRPSPVVRGQTSVVTIEPRRRPTRTSALGRLFGELVLLLVGAGAGDERRLQAVRDRLLRDRALDDIAARRQLEHDVEQ